MIFSMLVAKRRRVVGARQSVQDYAGVIAVLGAVTRD